MLHRLLLLLPVEVLPLVRIRQVDRLAIPGPNPDGDGKGVGGVPGPPSPPVGPKLLRRRNAWSGPNFLLRLVMSLRKGLLLQIFWCAEVGR